MQSSHGFLSGLLVLMLVGLEVKGQTPVLVTSPWGQIQGLTNEIVPGKQFTPLPKIANCGELCARQLVPLRHKPGEDDDEAVSIILKCVVH